MECEPEGCLPLGCLPPTYATVLIRLLQRSRANKVYIERKGSIVRNWLTRLLRLTGPRIYRVSRQTEDLGEW